MNRKSIAALAIAAVMTVGVGASSYAWFTSQATSVNNTVQTGTLAIGGTNGSTTLKTFTLDNLYPGAEGSKSDSITIKNNGTINLQYKVSSKFKGGVDNLYNVAKVKVTKASGEVVYNGNVNGLNGYLANSNLAVGSSETLEFVVSLPDDADNQYQGKTAYVDFVFDASQYNDTSFLVNSATGQAKTVVNVKVGATNDGVNYNSIKAAVDAVAIGGTVKIYPGAYNVTADSSNLVISKNNIKIVGCDVNGNPYTSAVLARNGAKLMSSAAANGAWLLQSTLIIQGDNVTIEGLYVEPSPVEPNKTIEVLGNNVNIKNTYINGNLYFNGQDAGSLDTFNIKNNTIIGGISITAGTGTIGNASARLIENNTIDTTETYGISFTGIVPTGWTNTKVGPASIKNNKFLGTNTYVRVLGEVIDVIDLEAIKTDNTFEKNKADITITTGFHSTYTTSPMITLR